MTQEDEGFEADFFDNLFFSDDGDQESDHRKEKKEKEDIGLGNKKESKKRQKTNEEYQISSKKTCLGPKVENFLKNDLQKITTEVTTADITNQGNQDLADQGKKKEDLIISVDEALRCGMMSQHKEGETVFYKCNICKIKVNGLKAITRHLEGAYHKKVLSKNPFKESDFISEFDSCGDKVPASKIENPHCPESVKDDPSQETKGIIENKRNEAELIKKKSLIELVNQELCLNFTCFFNKIDCFWCNIKLKPSEDTVKKHMAERSHRDRVPELNATAGLQKLESGFIKCLWCKKTLQNAVNLQSHLATRQHMNNVTVHGENAMPCHPWNRRGVCIFKKCPNLHKCATCGGKHPRFKCNAKMIEGGNEKGTQEEKSKLSRSPQSIKKELSEKTIAVLTGRIAESKIPGMMYRATSFKKGPCGTGSSKPNRYEGVPSLTSNSGDTSTIEIPNSVPPSIPISYGPNLSIPSPGYPIPSPPVVPSPTSLSSIHSIPSASGVYIPEPCHKAHPPYIPNPVPPSTQGSLLPNPYASVSDVYNPQPNHSQPYLVTSHDPTHNSTSISSSPITFVSNVYILPKSHSHSHISIPVPPSGPVSSMIIPSASTVSSSYSAPPPPRLHNQTDPLTSGPSLSLSSSEPSNSQIGKDEMLENGSIRHSISRIHEKLDNKYDDTSHKKRKRSSESKSPERKHRNYEKSSGQSNKKSDKAEMKNLKREISDRKIRSSKGKLFEDACNSLMSVCDKIGILGHTLKAALKRTQKFRNDDLKIVEILSDPECQELLLFVLRRLNKLCEETKDEILLSSYTDANIATTLLLSTTKSYLESSYSDLESKQSKEDYSINDRYGSNASIGILKRSTQIIFKKRNSEDLIQEEQKLIERVTEGKLDEFRDCEKEYASTSGFFFPSTISKKMPDLVDSAENITELKHEKFSTYQFLPKQFKRGVFKVAIFGHDYVDRLPVSSGRLFTSKTPGISYQVMKYSRHGAEIVKAQDYSIWGEVISAQPNIIFLILGKNDFSASLSPVDVSNGMLRIKLQLEKIIPNVDIVCFGVEKHLSGYYWSKFQEELNSLLQGQFSLFIPPSFDVDIGDENIEATMSVWFNMQTIIEQVIHQQIMINKFIPT